MQSIRKRLSIIIVFCSISAVFLLGIFVNITISRTFNRYMIDNQNQRNNRIVDYFQQIYKKDKKWTENSGKEIMHEAYMSNYCIILLDADRKVIWGMNPDEIRKGSHMIMNNVDNNRGIYKSKSFEIKSNKKIVGYVIIGQYSPVLLTQQDMNFKISINRSIMLSIATAVVIAIIISIIISKQFSEPIKAVSDTSVKLSKGNYDSKSNVKSRIKELNDLTQSINVLGRKLKEQDQIRKRLVSDISHEIRTPLNILQNNLEAMIDGIFPVDSEHLNYLNEEVIRFGKLLSNLNVLKQFEDEKLYLNKEVVLLDKLILDVSNKFLVDFKDKNIVFELNIEKNGNFQIQGDTDKLTQVFINLLNNALKFTPQGGKIYIDLCTNKNKIVVSIADNGIGIKKEDLPYIFERLYRGDKSRSSTEGSGIGLTIVKKILTLHHADIEVKSKVGWGTLCTLYFNGIGED
ncbi:MAG: HAMP domain-containing histidine kinase [Clostridium tyrobutyricum]|uniref:sensor histidine kinase n=1 Tax=Clostridium tyrobutyricum TaxID=1519 RepID=UPI00242D9253|nr:ATP-binding protein [Clostridium tyrobutyricum]MCH4198502.1 HAMP domain-containing histidine kinase [Clostridium tyrobutyricum]MCH4237438.1 HAMP domain-containing histidine kinase [Clostridium tyrobutyricum]MCH4259029.1 HAMP domain-containing histidine kinase [Clostridium tyrobutyricum]MCI1239881.1 HAMP domain-containing histidine kinase [Clostridium tyrobutyricum]MCI1652950.1 HAMP domain-containing histidine kinase [Clostridium tyrobutyricum]